MSFDFSLFVQRQGLTPSTILTKSLENLILKQMKNRLYSVLILLILLAFALSSDSMCIGAFPGIFAENSGDENPQSTQKQKFDYMSSILSRNTKPLGLKENVSLRKWLNQPSIIWAMRSGGRHILN
jgi:hypothetical protein